MKKFKLPKKFPQVRFKKSFWSYLILAILLIAGLFVSIIFERPDGKLHVNFYDVGQGDAIFIQTPKSHQILIDGGPDSKILSKLSANMPFYDKSLDLVVLTHPHVDHVNGLIDVLDHYQVEAILLTGILHNSPNYLEFLEKVREKEIETKIALAGMKIDYGDGPEFHILSPEKSLRGKRVDNLNNTSIVIRLDYHPSNGPLRSEASSQEGQSYLLTGDFEETGQDQISASDLKKYQADVLKVPHHGSYNGLSRRFLRAINPEIAIISVGANNRYGHPHQTLLGLLKNVQIFRTDQDGDIYTSVDTNGKLEVRTQK